MVAIENRNFLIIKPPHLLPSVKELEKNTGWQVVVVEDAKINFSFIECIKGEHAI